MGMFVPIARGRILQNTSMTDRGRLEFSRVRRRRVGFTAIRRAITLTGSELAMNSCSGADKFRSASRQFPGLTMKALCWHGKGDVRCDTVPDPKIQEPTDVIIKVTSTCICGSDLHLYDHYMPTMQSGDILGHEPM